MAKSEPDMEKEPKRMMDPFGISRTKEGEEYKGNFPTEVTSDLGVKGVRYANEEVGRMEQSGKYESVRTNRAYDSEGNLIIGMRAIFVIPKSIF